MKFLGVHIFEHIRKYSTKNDRPFIKFKKCLVFAKLSRYEYERKTLQNFNDQEFEKILRNRGTDFDLLFYYQNLYNNFQINVVESLRSLGIEFKVANRITCTKDMMDWADVILPIGGDGTYLLAASKIHDSKKPVIGFNSDPMKSEGQLCLPKKYSTDIREAIEKLQQGHFSWLMRNRIRTTLVGQKIYEQPTDLHKLDSENLYQIKNVGGASVRLPVLALNEVFIGESLSARVSYLELMINDDPTVTKVKSSGLCVSTGTGSTSWHYSINRLPAQSVAELLRLLEPDLVNAGDSDLSTRLADLYNKNLTFKADDRRMAYTIRDLISGGVWPSPKGIQPRGYTSQLRVKSRCFNAGLVIDGNVSFPFNDGTIAQLEIHPEDALRTVAIND